jgi:hypothetical protein
MVDEVLIGACETIVDDPVEVSFYRSELDVDPVRS